MPPKKYVYKKKVPVTTSDRVGHTLPKNDRIPSDPLPGSFLLIVESPSKISKIQSYLGTGYHVVASCGHIRYIKSLKDIDTDNQFRVNYHDIESKRAQIAQLRDAVGRFPTDHVIIATDNDREGEAIGYHLCMVLGLPIDTTPRIVFNEITATALQHAVRHPGKLNMSLVYSAMARQVLDVLIGFKISPVLWKYIYSSKTRPLSAGRCQTPALRLVYDHSQTHQKSTVSYRITANNSPIPHMDLSWTLSREFDDANDVRPFLDATCTYQHTFLGLGPCKVSRSAPPTPLNTSRLLQRASSALHWSPKQVMSVAQQLYQQGHITYMRTESTQYSREFLATAAAYIAGRWPTHAYVHPQLDKLANIDVNMPHEAVRVTHIEVTELPTKVSTQDDGIGDNITDVGNDHAAAALYRFLWKHTVESCMTESLTNTYLLSVSSPYVDCVYEHTLSVPTHLGWKTVGEHKISTDVGSILMYFQCLSVGSPVNIRTIEARIVERGRSGHYSEAGLIQALEDRGIGRPSTFATFVETIQERGYVTKRDVPGVPQTFTEFVSRNASIEEIQVTKNLGAERAKLVLEPLGHVCIEFLLKHFGELFDYSYTELMERALDAELNATTWYERCQHTLDDVTRMINTFPVTKITTIDHMKPVYRVSDADDCCIRMLEHGMVVQRIRSDQESIEYLPIKSGLEIDMNRLRQGSYMLHELVAYTNSYLGEYQGQPVTLGTGPYGHYVQMGKDLEKIRVGKELDKDLEKIRTGDKERACKKPINKNRIVTHNDPSMESSDKPIHKSLKGYTAKPLSEFTLADAIELLEGKPTVVEESTKIMRQLNDTMSIRRGKYGCYVYYRPTPTATPQFISLKKFPGTFLDVDIETVVKYAIEQCPRQASLAPDTVTQDYRAKPGSLGLQSDKPVSKSKYVSCKKNT
jgi:DNA topoisomerase-1